METNNTTNITNGKIEQLNKKMEQLDMQKKQCEKKLSAEKRKARTRRLIRIGAEVESVLGRPIEEDELPKLRKFLHDQELRGGYFSRAMEKY